MMLHIFGCTGGVAMFTRSLAHIGMGIRVNCLCAEVSMRFLFLFLFKVALDVYLKYIFSF